MNLKRIIRQIAKENGVTPAVVRKDMEESMRASMASSDPVAMAHWNNISKDGKEPKLEDFIAYLAQQTTQALN